MVIRRACHLYVPGQAPRLYVPTVSAPSRFPSATTSAGFSATVDATK